MCIYSSHIQFCSFWRLQTHKSHMEYCTDLCKSWWGIVTKEHIATHTNSIFYCKPALLILQCLSRKTFKRLYKVDIITVKLEPILLSFFYTLHYAYPHSHLQLKHSTLLLIWKSLNAYSYKRTVNNFTFASFNSIHTPHTIHYSTIKIASWKASCDLSKCISSVLQFSHHHHSQHSHGKHISQFS